MTLRLRLVLGLGVVAVVLVVVGVVVTRSTRVDLLQKVDQQLRSAAVAPGLAEGRFGDGRFGGPYRPGADGSGDGSDQASEGGSDGGEDGPPPGLASALPGPSTVWVGWLDGDTVVDVSTITHDGTTSSPVWSEAAIAAIRVDRFQTRPGDGGVDHFRVLAKRGPGGSTYLVGAPLDDVDSSVRQLQVVVFGSIALVLALLGLVALWVLRLGVRPIQDMTATATAIGAGDLSRRVPEADPRTEAGQLSAALNSMLRNIEEAFAASAASEDRLRRFVADASHELRTPITTIRGYAELHRRGGLEDPEARASAMARTEQEAVRMGLLVEDLLLLARLDQGRPLAAEPVDLATLAVDARDDGAAAHAGHPVTVDAAEGCVVVGDEHRLRQVVANLVGNAVRHTPEGTPITLTVAPVPDDARRVALEVRDEGPGMAPDLVARAFERFARGDVARSRAAGSTGLGLSIVQAIVAAHGGTVALDSTEGEGTTVRVVLPREAPTPEL